MKRTRDRKRGGGEAAKEEPAKVSVKTESDISKRWPKWAVAFLKSFQTTGVVSTSCRNANISRSVVYRLRDLDPEFAKAWKDAEDEATDYLETIALRRATMQENPSDTLLIFLLKARRPAKFRDNYRVELSGADGGPVQVDHSFEESLRRVYGQAEK